jgi:hypothetical protein
MVIQAQNAISQLQMPQNTQQPMENDEDDNTIQEVLNQIHTNNSQDTQYQQQLQQLQQMQQMQQLQQMQMQKESIQQSAQMPPQMMQQATPQQIPQIIQLPSSASQPQFDLMTAIAQANGGGSQPSASVIPDPLEGGNDSGLFGIIKSIADDVKFASFIFILFVIVHFIPIDKFLLKYFSIDRIPYYDILLKGLVAFVAVIVFRKVFACKK